MVSSPMPHNTDTTAMAPSSQIPSSLSPPTPLGQAVIATADIGINTRCNDKLGPQTGVTGVEPNLDADKLGQHALLCPIVMPLWCILRCHTPKIGEFHMFNVGEQLIACRR